MPAPRKPRRKPLSRKSAPPPRQVYTGLDDDAADDECEGDSLVEFLKRSSPPQEKKRAKKA